MKVLLIVLMMTAVYQYGFAQARKAPAATAPRRVAPKTAPLSPGKSRGPAAASSDPTIQVLGQNRNLNMMLILKNEKEAIDFIKMRKDYQEDSKNINY
jgi:hypothetical protein